MAVRMQTRRKRRVLIVENFGDLGTFLAGALRETGYNATIVESGIQARALSLRNIDIALVDAVLVGENGLSLAEFFSANSIPVIMMSGDRAFIENAGACGHLFLAKPFSISRLTAMLEEVMEAASSEAAISDS